MFHAFTLFIWHLAVLFSSLLSAREIMWLFACVKDGCAIPYNIYIVWHDKQIYIQHFKIMKNVQPGHLHFAPAPSPSPSRRHRHRCGKGRKNLITYFLAKRTRTPRAHLAGKSTVVCSMWQHDVVAAVPAAAAAPAAAALITFSF